MLAGVALVFIALQFFNPSLKNPPVVTGRDLLATDPMPPGTAATLRRACYDCHSDETTWPWYSHVAPFSWWLVDHVKSGRRHLNFSEWPNDHPDWAARRWSHISEAVRAGDMPLPSYTWIHRKSRLTAEERRQLADWAKQEAQKLQKNTE